MRDESWPKILVAGHHQVLIEAIRESHVTLHDENAFSSQVKTKYSPGRAFSGFPRQSVVKRLNLGRRM